MITMAGDRDALQPPGERDLPVLPFFVIIVIQEGGNKPPHVGCMVFLPGFDKFSFRVSPFLENISERSYYPSLPGVPRIALIRLSSLHVTNREQYSVYLTVLCPRAIAVRAANSYRYGDPSQ